MRVKKKQKINKREPLNVKRLAKIIVKCQINFKNPQQLNGPFPSSPGPLFQNEGRWCSAFDMEIIFHSHANKTHFHKKGCVPSLILKVKVF